MGSPGLIFRAAICRSRNALVDRLPAGKTFVSSVPVRDLLFAQLPAQQNGLALDEAGEIEEPDVEVFDLHADGVDLMHGVFNALQRLVALGASAGIVHHVHQ